MNKKEKQNRPKFHFDPPLLHNNKGVTNHILLIGRSPTLNNKEYIASRASVI